MTPTKIPALVVTRDGGALPPGASGTDLYVEDNDGNVVVQVGNGTAGALTITLEATATIAGMSVSGLDVEIPAGAILWVGPLPPALFNDDFQQAHITDGSGVLEFRALRF